MPRNLEARLAKLEAAVLPWAFLLVVRHLPKPTGSLSIVEGAVT